MRKKTWAWVAGGVLALCGVALAAALLTPRAIDVPYEYPVVPGTDEWFAMSGREQKAACQIPEHILERLTDEALAQSVLDYPFLVNLGAFSNPSDNHGVELVRREFNGLDELLERPGGLDALVAAVEQVEGDEGEWLRYLVNFILKYAGRPMLPLDEPDQR